MLSCLGDEDIELVIRKREREREEFVMKMTKVCLLKMSIGL